MENNIGNYVFVNGKINHINEFKYKDIDKIGLRYYEVLRVIKGHPVFLKEHIRRLAKSIGNADLDRRIKELLDENVLNENIRALININNYLDCNIKIVVNLDLDKYVIFISKFYYPKETEYENGINTVSYILKRDTPNKKKLDNYYVTKVKEIIKRKKVFEVILLDEEKYIYEGSRSNIFFIKDQVVITTPDEYVLNGVTRDYAIKCFISKNIKVEKRIINYNELKNMDGVFITGTSINILPVYSIDEFEYDVKGNKLIKKLVCYFNDYIKSIT